MNKRVLNAFEQGIFSETLPAFSTTDSGGGGVNYGYCFNLKRILTQYKHHKKKNKGIKSRG
jgi:hypothetical protein